MLQKLVPFCEPQGADVRCNALMTHKQNHKTQRLMAVLQLFSLAIQLTSHTRGQSEARSMQSVD